MKWGKFFFFFLLGIAFYHCKSDKEKTPDVTNIDLSVKIDRFDLDLFALDTNNIQLGLSNLVKKYPDFSEIFVQNLIITEPPQSPENTVRGFITFPAIKKLQDTVGIVFPNLQDVEKDLTQAMKYMKYYMPEKKTPSFLSFISEYSNAIVTYGDSTQSKFGIGLDMFLGGEYPVYEAFLPNYIKRSQDKKHLVSKVIAAIAEDIQPKPMGQRLLDQMIYNGRKLYLENILLPNEQDSILMEYTDKQTKWCVENEQNIWLHLISENILYSTDRDKIQKLVNPSPNAPNMPAEAPGRAGNFIGWKIVESFMKHNPNVTVSELFKISDAQYIMDKAKYKPERAK